MHLTDQNVLPIYYQSINHLQIQPNDVHELLNQKKKLISCVWKKQTEGGDWRGAVKMKMILSFKAFCFEFDDEYALEIPHTRAHLESCLPPYMKRTTPLSKQNKTKNQIK